jgi:hypothetical protein
MADRKHKYALYKRVGKIWYYERTMVHPKKIMVRYIWLNVYYGTYFKIRKIILCWCILRYYGSETYSSRLALHRARKREGNIKKNKIATLFFHVSLNMGIVRILFSKMQKAEREQLKNKIGQN